jgi:hypothetical protein
MLPSRPHVTDPAERPRRGGVLHRVALVFLNFDSRLRQRILPAVSRQLMYVGQLVNVMQERPEFTELGSACLTERLGRGMEKLIGEPACKLLEHLLRWRAARKQPARTLELGDPELVMMDLQCNDRRHDFALAGFARLEVAAIVNVGRLETAAELQEAGQHFGYAARRKGASVSCDSSNAEGDTSIVTA